MKFKRSSGILFHPTSLPGKYGIGTLGKSAYEFIDFICRAGQKLWQIYPLGPTGYGDSPYQCFSAFAGNPYLIDIDTLIADGLISAEDAKACESNNNNYIDFGEIYNKKPALLKKVFENFKKNRGTIESEFNSFVAENKFWLEDFGLFMALKDNFGGKSWLEWEDDIRFRKTDAMARYRSLLGDTINYYEFSQFLFFRQWNNLKKYANTKGIEIIGDIPIFVAMDSSDAWANPDIFLFDSDIKPIYVAGVPPDYFSATGQLWGNPLYNWEVLKNRKYDWWVSRVRKTLEIVDILRIDHFRGFESYWEVPFGETTAINGKWVKGPGKELFDVIAKELGRLPIIAEDLGIITDEVRELRDSLGFPGMKILQFAFDSEEEGDYMPHNITPNSVVYTGTHDNDTTKGWYDKTTNAVKERVQNYLNSQCSDIALDFIRAAWSSTAVIAVAPIQDFLKLGSEARINTPGVAAGNWQWRINESALTETLASDISKLTKTYFR